MNAGDPALRVPRVGVAAMDPSRPALPRLLLLGPPVLISGEGSAARHALQPQRPWQLLALLALHEGVWVPRERIAALFWPDHEATQARRNLRKVVFVAQSHAGEHALEVRVDALRWAAASDVVEFRAALQRGAHDHALALRRGLPFVGLEQDAPAALAQWFEAERNRLESAWHAAALDRMESFGAPAARIALARMLLERDPCDERAAQALMAAELARGDRVAAGSAYRDFARHLAQTLGIEPSRALARLLDEGAEPRSATAAPDAPPTPATTTRDRPGPGAAPMPRTAAAASGFVGRRVELRELGALLAQPDCRAVTLLGPGGIGKSRLAQQWLASAAAAADAEAVRRRWVALEHAPDAAAALAAIAQAIELRQGVGDDLLPALVERLGTERWCLVLDNAEQLCAEPGFAHALERLLAEATGLRLLITSRTRLPWSAGAGLGAVVPLSGLAVPDAESRDLEAARTFDAVQLFDLRARAALPAFDLARQLEPVLDIVCALGGMPLAIELAAAWVRLLPVAEIASALCHAPAEGRLDLLERDPGAAPPGLRAEHASLRAVLERTHTMLAPREREAFAALSVFAGGFTRAAAQAVAGCSLPMLSSLVDRSLLAVDLETGPTGRFTMHPVVHAYAAGCLAASALRQAALRESHGAHFAHWLGGLTPLARGDVARLVTELTPELPNAQAAWQAALQAERDDRLAEMATVLSTWHEICGRHHEALQLLRPALAASRRGAQADLAQARIAHGVALQLSRLGLHAEALAVARSVLPAAERCGDAEALAGCLLDAGACLWQLRDETSAMLHFERAVALARERCGARVLAVALGQQGALLGAQGRHDDAIVLLEQALEGSRTSADLYHVVVHLMSLAQAEGRLARHEQACRRLQEARGVAARGGLVLLELYAALGLGHRHREQGAAASAREAYEVVLRLAPRAGSGADLPRWTAELALARLDVGAGDAASALARLRRTSAWARPRQATWHLVWTAVIYGRALALLGDAPGAAGAWTAARATGWLEAPFQQTLDELLAGLPPAAVPGEPPTLEAVLDRLLSGAASTPGGAGPATLPSR